MVEFTIATWLGTSYRYPCQGTTVGSLVTSLVSHRPSCSEVRIVAEKDASALWREVFCDLLTRDSVKEPSNRIPVVAFRLPSLVNFFCSITILTRLLGG